MEAAEGVRSVGDVFNLIVMENGILAGTLTGATNSGKPAPITDPEKLQEALKTSYANLQQTIVNGELDSAGRVNPITVKR